MNMNQFIFNQPPRIYKPVAHSDNKRHINTFTNTHVDVKTVSLFSQPFLDTRNQCYKNIVVINSPPAGPLNSLVRRIQFPPLSEFKQPAPCSPLKTCGFALRSLNDHGCCDDLMTTDEVPNLISFLLSNNYRVDTSITKMFNTSDLRFETNIGNKLICFVTYQE